MRGDPQVARNPYPFYARLRRESPVRRLGPLVFVSTHATVSAALRDHRRLLNEPSAAAAPAEALSLLADAERRIHDELLEFERGYMSRRDGADHARVRSAAQAAFTAGRGAERRDATQRLTDELLDELSQHERPDLMELAHRLPLLVIMSLLGAPHEDGELLKGWADDMNHRRREMPMQPESIHRANRGLTAYRAYVAELVERGQRELPAALSVAERDGRLTREELVATCMLVLFAGHETTANLIGNAVLALLERRDAWRLLCDDHALAPAAVEEALRYDAPVQISLRTAGEALELGGVEIPAGSSLWLLIGSANRDPQAFADPDDLRLARRPNNHLSLGHGVHVCLGGGLARLEAQVVLSTLARRFPALELAADPATLPRSTHPSMRALTSLPVELRG